MNLSSKPALCIVPKHDSGTNVAEVLEQAQAASCDACSQANDDEQLLEGLEIARQMWREYRSVVEADDSEDPLFPFRVKVQKSKTKMWGLFAREEELKKRLKCAPDLRSLSSLADELVLAGMTAKDRGPVR